MLYPEKDPGFQQPIRDRAIISRVFRVCLVVPLYPDMTFWNLSKKHTVNILHLAAYSFWHFWMKAISAKIKYLVHC